jgi:hypothetical protein
MNNLLLNSTQQSKLKELLAADIAKLEDELKKTKDTLRSIEKALQENHDTLKQFDLTDAKERASLTKIKPADINETNLSEYDIQWKWWDKVCYILNDAPNGMTTAEIVHNVLSFEPTLKAKSVTNSISSVLSVHARKANTSLIRISNGQNEFSYLLRPSN